MLSNLISRVTIKYETKFKVTFCKAKNNLHDFNLYYLHSAGIFYICSVSKILNTPLHHTSKKRGDCEINIYLSFWHISFLKRSETLGCVTLPVKTGRFGLPLLMLYKTTWSSMYSILKYRSTSWIFSQAFKDELSTF